MERLNQIFELLSRDRRRFALYALENADGPVEIEDLADRIQQWEESAEDVSPDDFGDVVLSLHHTHLPKASQAEYIEYDRDDEEIRVSGEPPEFEIILKISEAIERADQKNVLDLDSIDPQEFLSRFTSASHTSD